MLFYGDGKKKMSTTENLRITDNSNIVNYLPAEICSGKEIYIQYYVKEPGGNNLSRKRIKLNRAKKKLSKTEFKAYTRSILKNLNEKLASGWNPFLEQEAPHGFVLLREALSTFLASKKKELTKNSMRSFQSFVNTLLKYCETDKKTDLYVLNFSQSDARNFLNKKWLSENISAKTYNNYIVGYHAIWAWLVEFGYSKVNVFDSITRKRTKQKIRVEIPSEIRMKIKNELLKNSETAYWLMCELCFYCLIRPGEMTAIKTKNINLEKQIIVLDETKNQNQRISTIPKHLIVLIREHLNKGQGRFLFSSENGFLPGEKKIDPRIISKRWEKLRKQLCFEKSIQFYSLRDSGIIYLIGKTNAEYVRSQADHYSLEMTTNYSKHLRPSGIDDLKNIEAEF